MGLPLVDPRRYTRSIKARRLRGAAALMEMLELIGAENCHRSRYGGGDDRPGA
jgi:hypothetical protein